MICDMPHFDVAVVGGGPAGTAAAIRSARLGSKVILLEGSDYDSPRVGETLPPSIYTLFLELGIWPIFQSLGPIPSYGNQSAWGDSQIRSSSFIANPYGSGWHIDRQFFDSMLSDQAAKAGACVITGVHVTRCNWEEQRGWVIEFQRTNHKARFGTLPASSSCFYTKGLIDATGRRSILAQRLGAKRIIYDCLAAIAVQFKTKTDAGAFTLVETTKEGWWYSAPLPGSRLIAMFMTDLDLLPGRRLTHITEWMKGLEATEHTAVRCRGHMPIWGPHIFSALSQRLKRPASGEKWLAVGDAAMAVDPLSACGIYNAFRSGSMGATAIERWLAGDSTAIDIYEQDLDSEFKKYLQLRRQYYSMETRFSDSPFWTRRTNH
jgi:flavin-dependent dehydrogenase